MNFEEYAAKPLLAAAGIAVPESILATTPDAAADAAERIGPCVVKAQVATGKRGKAGGIKLAATPDEARAAAEAILGMRIGIYDVERVLVEAQADIASEFYASVLNDQATKGPLIMFSTEGGMDIEEVAAQRPEKLVSLPVDVRTGPSRDALLAMLSPFALGGRAGPLAEVLGKLYDVYTENDGELVEVNPLIVTGDGQLVALDCKFTMDDSGAARRQRRGPHHDDDGHGPLLRRAAGEFPGDRRRGLHTGQAGARTGHGESEHQEPADQFLRRLRPHRRDDRGHRRRLGAAQADPAGVFLDPRHRRCGSGRHGARTPRHGAL
jgi:succinyl-CoA synthetase beta subunit